MPDTAARPPGRKNPRAAPREERPPGARAVRAILAVAVYSLAALLAPATAAAPPPPSRATPAPVEPPRPPDILFVLTDDQRHDAMGVSGHPWLETPSMDRLAREGARFTNAFVTSSICSPSRASILTGQYPHRHGVVGNELMDIPAGLPTFPEILRSGGYETAFVGKWHMGSVDHPRPGFDRWIAFGGQGVWFGGQMNVDGALERFEGYLTDALTDYALGILEAPRDRPLFLMLAHKAPHVPWTPAPRHARAYEDEDPIVYDSPSDDIESKPLYFRRVARNRRRAAGIALPRREQMDYWRTLLAVDESLARLLDSLERRGRLDRTVVIFTSDNGLLLREHGGMADKRRAYEPSIRVPLLLRYPPLVRPGRTCDALALNVDLGPTVLHLAGLAPHPSMQGRSLVPLLRGRRGRKSFLYEYFQEARFPRTPTLLAVRTRRWKFIVHPFREGEIDELYDLKKDPGELWNLAERGSHRRRVRKMQRILERLKAETGFRWPELPVGPTRET